MDWFWIFAFVVAGVCLVGGIVWSILWRKREKKALIEALIIQVHEEDLEASRNQSKRQSGISEGPSRDVAEYRDSSRPSGASSCQSLPSTSSKDRLYHANNNEMEMNVMAGPVVSSRAEIAGNQIHHHDNDQATDSDWQDDSRGTASPIVDTDFSTSADSRPNTASSVQSSGISEPKTGETDNNNMTIPTVAFHENPKRGQWKPNRTKTPPQEEKHAESHAENVSVKYERIKTTNQREGQTTGSVTYAQPDPEKGMILVPVQSESDSDVDSYATHL